MTAPSCRICGHGFGADERTVAELRAQLAAAEARAAAAAKLARGAGVPEATIRSALWRAERKALNATPSATLGATPAAPIPEPPRQLRAAAATPDATPDATLGQKGAPDVIVNACARARVEVQEKQEQENKTKARAAARASPWIPKPLFKAFAQHWQSVAKRVTGNAYGDLEPREMRIAADVVHRHGLPRAIGAVDALEVAWRARAWFTRDKVFTLALLERRLPDLLHGPGSAPAPRPRWSAQPLPELETQQLERPPPAPPPEPPRVPAGDVPELVAGIVARLGAA